MIHYVHSHITFLSVLFLDEKHNLKLNPAHIMSQARNTDAQTTSMSKNANSLPPLGEGRRNTQTTTVKNQQLPQLRP